MIPTLEKLCAHSIFTILYKKYRYDNFYYKIPISIYHLNIPNTCRRKILKRLNKIPLFNSRQEFLDYYKLAAKFEWKSKKDYYLLTYYIVKFDLIEILLKKINKPWDFKLLTTYLLTSKFRQYKVKEDYDGGLRAEFNMWNYGTRDLIEVIKKYKNKPWDLDEINKYEQRKKGVYITDDSKYVNYYNIASKLTNYNAIRLFVEHSKEKWNFKLLSQYYSELPQVYDNVSILDPNYDSDYENNRKKQIKKVFITIQKSTGIDFSNTSYDMFYLQIYFETLKKFKKIFNKKINEDWDYNLLIDQIDNSFIEENLGFSWDFNLLIEKLGVDLKLIEKIFKNIDYKKLSDNIPVEKLGSKINRNWDFDKLSERCHDWRWWRIVGDNKNKPWNLKVLNDNLLEIIDSEKNNAKLNFLERNRMKSKSIWSIINKLDNYA